MWRLIALWTILDVCLWVILFAAWAIWRLLF
jgi:hypothetical protein